MATAPDQAVADRTGASANAPPAVQAIQATKMFLDGAVIAYRNLDLEIERQEILCIVGPSGCGKTTLLRSIAGLTCRRKGDRPHRPRPKTQPDRDQSAPAEPVSP